MARATTNDRFTGRGRRTFAGRRAARATGGLVSPASRAVMAKVAVTFAVMFTVMFSGGFASRDARAVEVQAPPLPPAAHLRAGADAAGGDAATRDDARRLYVTGMVGSSLAMHGGSDSRDMISGGLLAGGLPAGDGALGVSIPRGVGDVRLEFEGRSGLPSGGTADGPRGDSWSVMANVWRDLPITDHLGGYLGGGLGAAGLPTDAGTRGGVAGQAGAGLTYAAHDRMTFDVGYRLHAATDGRSLPGGGAALASSELLLSVRIYDPFRSWAR